MKELLEQYIFFADKLANFPYYFMQDVTIEAKLRAVKRACRFLETMHFNMTELYQSLEVQAKALNTPTDEDK